MKLFSITALSSLALVNGDNWDTSFPPMNIEENQRNDEIYQSFKSAEAAANAEQAEAEANADRLDIVMVRYSM